MRAWVRAAVHPRNDAFPSKFGEWHSFVFHVWAEQGGRLHVAHRAVRSGQCHAGPYGGQGDFQELGEVGSTDGVERRRPE